jgi:hypothetical protein
LQADLGLKGTPIGEHGGQFTSQHRATLEELLSRGELVVSSYTCGKTCGHYILLVGMDENGNYLANNPWGGTMEVRDPDTYFKVVRSLYHIYK